MLLSWSGLFFSFIASLGWVGFDVTRKKLSLEIPAIPLIALLMLGQLPFFLSWALWVGDFTVKPGYWLPASGTILLNLLANLLFLASVRRSPLSVTIPMLAFTPVFVALLGIFTLSEIPFYHQWVGIGFVVCGAFLINAQTQDLRNPKRLLTSFFREPGIPMMMGVALLWSFTSIFDRLSLTYVKQPIHGLFFCIGVGGSMMFYLLFSRNLSQLSMGWAHRKTLLLSICCSSVAFGTQLMAYSVMAVSLVEAFKRGVGQVLAVFNGRLFFHEPFTKMKFFSIFLLTLGVSLTLL